MGVLKRSERNQLQVAGLHVKPVTQLALVPGQDGPAAATGRPAKFRFLPGGPVMRPLTWIMKYIAIYREP